MQNEGTAYSTRYWYFHAPSYVSFRVCLSAE
jgi:hypothetical protein